MYIPILSELLGALSFNVPKPGELYVERKDANCPFAENIWTVEVVEVRGDWVKFRSIGSTTEHVRRRRQFNAFFVRKET